jgi:uncharacterized ion transporter superfamily protein YfcC
MDNQQKQKKRQQISPITILMVVIVFAALATWVIPTGTYQKMKYSPTEGFVMQSIQGKTVSFPATQDILDSLQISIPLEKFEKGDILKPISVPNTYARVPKASQGLLQIMQAPIKGIYESIDIILFILIIGSFSQVFTQTGALVRGIAYLSASMKGRERLLIIILTSIFSFLGASYGMAEEALVFYPLLVPLLLAAGYDLLVPFAIIFGGVTIGGIAGFSNPFSTIIASNAAGINWMDGLYQRLFVFVSTTFLFIAYLLRYAAKVKANPSASLVLKLDGDMQIPFEVNYEAQNEKSTLDIKTWILLFLYGLSFIAMIMGVIFLKWWTLEMTSLFLGTTLLVGLIDRMNQADFVKSFMQGAESLLSVAFIVGVARGVSIILNEGMVTDTLLYQASIFLAHIPAWAIILMLFVFYFFFSFFISSTSGMAVLTMPIMGGLALLVNIPGREVVNAYLFGINLMALISPTNLILPSLAMVNMSYKVWLAFIRPILILFIFLCALFLLTGINL